MTADSTAEQPHRDGVSPTFGALLRSMRAAADLTQEQLAERSGVSVRAISDLEREVKTRPQRATVDLLAEGLDLGAKERAELIDAVPSRRRRVGQERVSLDLPVGGFLGAVSGHALVARQAEIERIRSLVDLAVSGAGQLLLLSGEAGAGKTRLAAGSHHYRDNRRGNARCSWALLRTSSERRLLPLPGGRQSAREACTVSAGVKSCALIVGPSCTLCFPSCSTSDSRVGGR